MISRKVSALFVAFVAYWVIAQPGIGGTGPQEEVRANATGATQADKTPNDTPEGTTEAVALVQLPEKPAMQPMTFATYNAGLAHGAVALANERLPLIAEALTSIDADVLCLEEVWTDDDASAIIEKLSGSYPYHFRERTVDTSEPTSPCGIWRTYWLSRCVTSKCSKKGISAEECVGSGPCKAKYDALNDDCKRCLAANTAGPTSCAIGGAQDFVSEGRNGLLLMSRLEISDPLYVEHDTLLVKRGMIAADINGYHTICTHLSADLGVVPYPSDREFISWEDEHAAQIQTIAEAFPADQCTVLMGDLNSGPATDTLAGELPDNFELLSVAGFTWPWDNPVCSWCTDNPLAGSEKNKLIDYIMFRGCPAGAEAYHYRRIMDQPITIAGQEQPTRLSDHYGVIVEVKP